MALSRFDFVVTNRRSSQQGKTNALSCHAYLASKEGDVVYDQQKRIILKPKHLVLHSLISNSPKDLSIIGEIQKTFGQDLLVKNVQKQIKDDKGEDFEFKNGLLFFQSLIYVSLSLTRLNS